MSKKPEAQPKSHIYNAKECWCGTWHYTCDICGVDCTMGTPDGPCNSDTRGVRRCRPCHWKWGEIVAALRPDSIDDVILLREALHRYLRVGNLKAPLEPPADPRPALALLNHLDRCEETIDLETQAAERNRKKLGPVIKDQMDHVKGIKS